MVTTPTPSPTRNPREPGHFEHKRLVVLDKLIAKHDRYEVDGFGSRRNDRGCLTGYEVEPLPGSTSDGSVRHRERNR